MLREKEVGEGREGGRKKGSKAFVRFRKILLTALGCSQSRTANPVVNPTLPPLLPPPLPPSLPPHVLEDVADAVGALDAGPAKIGNLVVAIQGVREAIDLLPHRGAHVTEVNCTGGREGRREGGREGGKKGRKS